MDELDIEGLYQFYIEHQIDLPELTLEEWHNIVQGYINRTKKTECMFSLPPTYKFNTKRKRTQVMNDLAIIIYLFIYIIYVINT